MTLRTRCIAIVFLASGCVGAPTKPEATEPSLDEPRADAISGGTRVVGRIEPGVLVTAQFGGSTFVGLELEVDVASDLVFDVRAPGRDPVTHLYGPKRSDSWRDAARVAMNDDFGGSLDSHIEETLTPGRYLVVVRDFDRRSGSFRASVEHRARPTPDADAGRDAGERGDAAPPETGVPDAGTVSFSHPASGNACGVEVPTCVGELCSISVGAMAYCAAARDGRLLCAGVIELFDLADRASPRIDALRPIAIAIPEPVVDASLSDHHACALTSTGSVFCWGDNAVGQLGNGEVVAVRSFSPASRVALPRRAIRLATAQADAELGGLHSCAILDDCSVACWGFNVFGQVGIGSDAPRFVPTPMVIPGFRARDLALAEQTSSALGVDGRVYTWGGNSHGLVDPRLGHVRTDSPHPLDLPGLENVHQIAIMGGMMCALDRDMRRLTCWGHERFRTIDGSYARIESGETMLAITTEGTLVRPPVGLRPTSNSPIVTSPPSTPARASHSFMGTCSLSTSGTLECEGFSFGSTVERPFRRVMLP